MKSRWLLPTHVAALLLGANLLTACASDNVAGSYSTGSSATVDGAVIGGVGGAAIAGVATNNAWYIPLGALVGAMLGGTVGHYYDQDSTVKQLAKQGVTVVKLGDIVEVIIPADLVLDPETNELLREATPMLDQIVALLNQYSDVNMAIIGHSDNVGSDDEQTNRSQIQAQAIMSYIWSHGVALPRLEYYGLGDKQTDASLKYTNGQAYNRHIDIVFWRKGSLSSLTGWFAGHNANCWTSYNPNDCDTQK